MIAANVNKIVWVTINLEIVRNIEIVRYDFARKNLQAPYYNFYVFINLVRNEN